MYPVLLQIPGTGLKIFGYGLMLVIAFFLCPWVAARTAEKDGVDPGVVERLTTWLIVSGLIGGRLFFMIQYRERYDRPLIQFFQLWEGGLVVYGAAMGALAGVLIYAWRNRVSSLWLLDTIAPAVVLGYAIGRVGCLLNGCCWGDVCDAPWAVRFPAGSPPAQRMVDTGLQTRFGFALESANPTVSIVEPGTAAARAGLRPGSHVLSLDGQPVASREDAGKILDRLAHEPRSFPLTFRDSSAEETTVVIDPPRTLPLHPTQLYSTINGLVLFLFLLALYPFRRHDGEIIGLMAVLYSIGRFLVEYLRFDERALADGFTISQNLSFLMMAAGLTVLAIAQFRAPRPPAGERIDRGTPAPIPAT